MRLTVVHGFGRIVCTKSRINYYRQQRSCGKVMSVIVFTGGVSATHPRLDTPLRSACQDTMNINKRAVRILLEYILVN